MASRASLAFPQMFDDIIGPTLPLDVISSLGTVGSQWVTGFQQAEAAAWNFYGSTGAPTFSGSVGTNFVLDPYNYYGRDQCYAAFWKMSGYTNDNYYNRFLALAQHHYDNFYAPNNALTGSAIQPWRQMNKGMALLYAATGVSNILLYLGAMGDYNKGVWTPGADEVVYGATPAVGSASDGYGNYYYGLSPGPMDARSRARPLESFVLNHICNAPSPGTGGGYPGGNDWVACAKAQVNKILAGQDPTGTWREPGAPAWKNFGQDNVFPGNVGVDGRGSLATLTENPYRYANKPFEVGLITDAMQMHYDSIEQDSRIPTSIAATMNCYLTTPPWAGNTGPTWNAANKAWKYLEFAGGTDGYSAQGQPILNGLILPGAAFLYRVTGNSFWKTHTEDALSQIYLIPTVPGSPSADGWLQKQVNQTWSRSYKAFPSLYPQFLPSTAIRMKWS